MEMEYVTWHIQTLVYAPTLQLHALTTLVSSSDWFASENGSKSNELQHKFDWMLHSVFLFDGCWATQDRSIHGSKLFSVFPIVNFFFFHFYSLQGLTRFCTCQQKKSYINCLFFIWQWDFNTTNHPIQMNTIPFCSIGQRTCFDFLRKKKHATCFWRIFPFWRNINGRQWGVELWIFV